MRIPKTWTEWLRGIFGGFIGGAAAAGAAWFGMGAAKMAGMDVPSLNFKALGIIMLSAGIPNALAYLAKSPLPAEATTTVTDTLTVTQTSKTTVAPTPEPLANPPSKP